MEILTYISISILALFCVKPLLMFFFTITSPLEGLYQRHKENKIFHIFHFFIFLDHRLLRGDGLRWFLYHVSLFPSNHYRRFIYRCLGAKIAKNSIVHFKTEVRAPERLSLGEGSIVGDNAILDARSGLFIGQNVNISSNVSIYSLQHDYRDPLFKCPDSSIIKMSVEIGDYVWLGSNVVVLPGVSIGEGAVCCANCVVTKDIEPYAVVAGVPAKKIGERPRNIAYKFNGKCSRFY